METSRHHTLFNDDQWIENERWDDTFLINRFPYASRLTSNDVPSDDEMQEIKAFLYEPKEKLQQMEAEIASLQARVAFLQERHAALKKEIEVCQSLITIPRRLPDDILLEIFFRCLPETMNPTLDGESSPILLTAICRRWRLLALQTPRLWSTIELNCQDMSNWLSCAGIKDTTTFIDSLLSRWLERSGTCPFTFTICRVYNNSNSNIVTACSNLMLRFSSQWKNVFLCGEFQTLTPFFIDLPPNLESLESLFLHFSDDIAPTLPTLDFPTLRKVSIRCYALDCSTLALPWIRLTHLDLGSRYRDNHKRSKREAFPKLFGLSTLLNQCTSLIYLGLDVDYKQNVNPRIYLPCLQRLNLRQVQPLNEQDFTASNVFGENLEAPSIHTLSLRNFSREAFLAIVSKHGRRLQSLDLNIEYRITNGDLADGLRHCPSLQSLSLLLLHARRPCHFKANEIFFRFFTGDIGDDTNALPGPLCPLLQDLSIDCLACYTLTGLVSFVKKKQNGALQRDLSPLKKLIIPAVWVDGHFIERKTVTDVLQPFIDKRLHFEMWPDRDYRPFSYGGTKDWYDFWGKTNSRFQHADCWRD